MAFMMRYTLICWLYIQFVNFFLYHESILYFVTYFSVFIKLIWFSSFYLWMWWSYLPFAYIESSLHLSDNLLYHGVWSFNVLLTCLYIYVDFFCIYVHHGSSFYHFESNHQLVFMELRQVTGCAPVLGRSLARFPCLVGLQAMLYE